MEVPWGLVVLALWLGMEMEALGESGGIYCPRNLKCHRRGSADPEAPGSFCETRGVTTTEQRGSLHPQPEFRQISRCSWGVLEGCLHTTF